MTYKKWLVVAIALFVLGGVLSIATPSLFEGLLSEEIAQLERLGQTHAPFSVSTFLFIFARNTVALLVSFALSPFFIIAPAFSLFNNGLLLTYVAREVAQQQSVLYVLGGLLPHGIVEIPAFIIGQAAALSFGATVIQAVFKKNKRKQLAPGFKQNLKYLGIAVGLLLPAAAIETYVSPLLLGQ